MVEEIKTSAGWVKKLGQKFIDWGQDIDKAYVELDAAFITPGSATDAATLKNNFTDRLKKWKENISGLRQMFDEVGNRLVTLANNYEGTEDINKADAEKVRDVINSVEKYLPGAGKVIQPEPGTGSYYPPSNNKPNK